MSNSNTTLNERFMMRSTFFLGGNLGISFLILYFVELVFLCFNPIDVMSPTEGRYLFNHVLRHHVEQPLFLEYIYDFSCWLLDVDKLIAYSLFCLWSCIFAGIVCRDSVAQWHPKKNQTDELLRMMRHRRRRFVMLPFWFNVIIAFLITIPAAGSATRLFGDNLTSLIRVFTGDPISWDPWFLLYRAAYATFMFIWCLHLVVGLQTLFLNADRVRNITKKKISKYFFVLLQFLIIAFVLESFVLALTIPGIGSVGWHLFAANQHLAILGLIICVITLGVLLLYESDVNKPIGKITVPKANIAELRKAVSLLPRYAILPIAFLVLPLSSLVFSIYDTAIITTRKSELTPCAKYLNEIVNPKGISTKEIRERKRTVVWILEDRKLTADIMEEIGHLPIDKVVQRYSYLWNKKQNQPNKANAADAKNSAAD